MSWFLTAGNLVHILENWTDLTKDGQYLYMLYLQSEIGHRMTECLTTETIRGRKVSQEERDNGAKNAHNTIFYHIASFGSYALKEFKGLKPGFGNTPEMEERFKIAEKKIKYWLEQVYCDGYPYDRPPRILKDKKDD